jgi:hypothetical protein
VEVLVCVESCTIGCILAQQVVDGSRHGLSAYEPRGS